MAQILPSLMDLMVRAQALQTGVVNNNAANAPDPVGHQSGSNGPLNPVEEDYDEEEEDD